MFKLYGNGFLLEEEKDRETIELMIEDYKDIEMAIFNRNKMKFKIVEVK